MNVEVKSFQMLPPAPGKCRVCAVAHEPNAPHNAQSLFYQTQFQGKFNRAATWADAVAHCDENTREAWKRELVARGGWTEPADGVDPIDQPVIEAGGKGGAV